MSSQLVAGVAVVVAAGGTGGVTVACETGMMRASLACKYAWLSGSPKTVKTAIVLQI